MSAAPKDLPEATTLAIERTRLAAERTMMAWTRTAMSLITFGFSVYKFFDIQRESSGTEHKAIGSREFALFLIVAGLLSLLFATIQQWQSMRLMRARYPSVHTPRSLAAILAMLVSGLGFIAFWVVISRQ